MANVFNSTNRSAAEWIIHIILCAFLFLAIVFLLTGCMSGDYTLNVENDIFSPTDNRDDNYTNGFQITKHRPEGVSYHFGQTMFTPDDLRTSDEIKDDRPYAGHLYIGRVKNEEGEAFGKRYKDTYTLQLGCTGDCSLAREAQKFVHNDLGFGTDPKGWRHQIDTEPTLQAGVRTDIEFGNLTFPSISPGVGADLLGHVAFDFGNVRVSTQTGGTLRVGYNLPIDFGPTGINPTYAFRVQDSDWFFYIFGGADARSVVYNMFIDNHLFNSGTDLELENFVYDLKTGFSFGYDVYRMSYTFVERSDEFVGDGSKRFGMLQFEYRI